MLYLSRFVPKKFLNLSFFKEITVCVLVLVRQINFPIRFISVAHCCPQCRRDITIRGIHIPKGAVVAASIIAIHHDPDIYPEPDKFEPERYMWYKLNLYDNVNNF